MIANGFHLSPTLVFCAAALSGCASTIGGDDNDPIEEYDSGTAIVDASVFDAADGAAQTPDAASLDASTGTTYELDVLLQGPQGPFGTVTSTPAGINCGALCTKAYPESTQVTLTIDAPGQHVCGWLGDVPGPCFDNAVCTLTMDQDRTARAFITETSGLCP